MDNLKYYNDSVAYDFEMFAPRPVEKRNTRDNIVVMPQQKAVASKRSKAAARRVSAPATLIMCAVIVLAGFCGNIALRLQINEVNSKINQVKTSIAELDSEKTALEVEMQRRISYANVELEASELGMVKPEKEKVVYIHVNDKDTAKTADGKIVKAK